MTKTSLSLHLDDATTYATVFQGERAVASVRRRRMFGEADRKTWTVYDLEGAELFQTNLGSVTIRSRLSSILKAREEAAKPSITPNQRVRYEGDVLADRKGAEGIVTFVGQTKTFVRFDGSEGGTACDPANLVIVEAPEVCDKTHNAIVSVSALALFQAGNVDQAWTLAQLDTGLDADVTKEAWTVWAYGALRARKEA
jgi:hypothetical protein